MSYSRNNPSPRYLELSNVYLNYHADRQDRFVGASLRPHLGTIRTLIASTGSSSILDYGSGKGLLYKEPLPGGLTVRQFWNVENIQCFDPGVPEFSRMPDEAFDGVISTDVLEHCPEEDIPWIVGEMFAHARKFIFANIANYPAKKTLPNGENAHCTQWPAERWKTVFDTAARASVIYRIEVDTKHTIPFVGKTIKKTTVVTGGKRG